MPNEWVKTFDGVLRIKHKLLHALTFIALTIITHEFNALPMCPLLAPRRLEQIRSEVCFSCLSSYGEKIPLIIFGGQEMWCFASSEINYVSVSAYACIITKKMILVIHFAATYTRNRTAAYTHNHHLILHMHVLREFFDICIHTSRRVRTHAYTHLNVENHSAMGKSHHTLEHLVSVYGTLCWHCI